MIDLLARHRIGELRVDIPVIVSNHPDLASIAAAFNIPFEVIPVTPETKPSAETRALTILGQAGCDFVVLARYMQILSPDQDVIPVGHRDTVQELTRKGRDVERVVLARAVRAHAESRVLANGRKTVVFD